MENNAMTAPLDKKTVLKNLIEKGKANGQLTTQDIDQALLDIDLDLEDVFRFLRPRKKLTLQ